ncbi:MAG: (2Fe-2S) ferredoxin domain-containing protein [Candidatus Moranbacteria bacterium]|nr:(2Fe-2S) ferredoxin domain-containing protein [Candidatus Moranbacteria bacterium]
MGRFQKHIFICTNERPADHPKGCCSRKGSEGVKDKFKVELKKRGLSSQVRANASGCLDACEFGPTVVIYPEGVWYSAVTENDVEEIIDKHIVGGKAIDHLKIKDTRYISHETVNPIKK